MEKGEYKDNSLLLEKASNHPKSLINIKKVSYESIILYRVSQKTWEFSDEFDIVFSDNSLI